MNRFGRALRSVSMGRTAVALAVAVTLGMPQSATAIDVVTQEDFTLGIGLRLQPRLELENEVGPGGTDWRRDFLLRRSRLSAFGKMQNVYYKLEWKVDGTDQVASAAQTAIGAITNAQLENGYLQYPVGNGVEIRAGLYDLPYSRDRLTSDSQQLAVDRGAVSNVPNTLGLVDNGVGLHVLGNINGGRAQYAVGLFDNRTLPTRRQDIPMLVGRLDLNFGSTTDIFTDAHFGDQRWYSLGVNGSFQGGLEGDSLNQDEGSYSAVGADGMMDVPMGAGPTRVFVRGEVNSVNVTPPTGGDGVTTTVWMAGAGLLLWDQRLQPMIRYDQVLLDDAVGGGSQNITYVGGTWFQRKHNLKIQADVRFESGTTEDVDGARLQAQINY